MMNSHVERYYLFLLWVADRQGNRWAQMLCYTALMLERDPNWSPYA